MRSALTAALSCGVVIGAEATAFAWLIDIILVDFLNVSGPGIALLGWSGVVLGVLVCAWTAVKVYRAEVRIAAGG